MIFFWKARYFKNFFCLVKIKVSRFFWVHFSNDPKAIFERVGIKNPTELEIRMIVFNNECKGLVKSGLVSEKEFSWLTTLFGFDMLGKGDK
jgi:hypothetical protein